MLTITVSFHMYMTKNTWLLFMFELMIASGAKPMIIVRNVSLFYSKLVHFRLISGVIITKKKQQNYGRRLRTGFKTYKQ